MAPRYATLSVHMTVRDSSFFHCPFGLAFICVY